jgi:hypothetical protein
MGEYARGAKRHSAHKCPDALQAALVSLPRMGGGFWGVLAARAAALQATAPAGRAAIHGPLAQRSIRGLKP